MLVSVIFVGKYFATSFTPVPFRRLCQTQGEKWLGQLSSHILTFFRTVFYNLLLQKLLNKYQSQNNRINPLGPKHQALTVTDSPNRLFLIPISHLFHQHLSPQSLMDNDFLGEQGGMWDLSSPTRDRTRIPCRGSAVLTTGLPGKSLITTF